MKKLVKESLNDFYSFPIGAIHNGYKKIADNTWVKVSKHGMTKKEHEKERENEYAAKSRIEQRGDGSDHDPAWVELEL
jgi:hypothetical protein